MKNFSKSILFKSFVVVSLLFQQQVSAQNVAKTIVDGLDYWANQFPQEKVFIQTDKKQILQGEDVWFKAWCTYNGKPTFLSRILYMDMVDKNGVVVQKKMYRLDSSGSANGFINIDNKIASGTYSINCYTHWMLNFPGFIAKETLQVIGLENTNPNSTVAAGKIKTMMFFPEGGELIGGIQNRVAFKILDQAGRPVACSGKIKDQNDRAVADFMTEHDGMGVFQIEPELNNQYKAEITDANGATLYFTLPKQKDEGVTFMVQNTKSRLFAIVNRAEKNKNSYNELLLVAHINGRLVYVGNYNIEEGKTAASISKKGLPAGVLHLTLFDTSGRPLAERLAFIDNQQVIKPSVNLKTKNTSKRGLNEFSFSIDSSQAESISVLVRANLEQLSFSKEQNIISSLLLSSDIKGSILNPGYYFTHSSDTLSRHLDLLMMTQGWRRFTWADVIAKKEPALKHYIESDISLKGKVTKTDRPDLITSGKVAFIIKGEDSTKIMADAYITDKGEFILDSLNFKKKATVFFEAQDNKRQKAIVDVNFYQSYIDTLKLSSNLPPVSENNVGGINQDTLWASMAKRKLSAFDSSAFGYARLADVTVRTKKKSRIDSLESEYVTPAFAMSDNTIDFTDARGLTNIWQYLQMQVSGFAVEPFNGGGATARFTRNEGIRGLSDEVGQDGIKFMLNEVEVPVDVIDNISPGDVAIVKVYKGNLAFPWGANQGMIAIYTRKGVDVKRAPYEKVFSKIEVLGYESNKEFYNVDYQVNPTFNANTSDDRITLYWNPNLKKKKDGVYQVKFYNSDISNKFQILIQGLDKNGKLIYHEIQTK